MKPIDIACRHCAQQPGESCKWGGFMQLKDEGIFHAERIEDAALWTTGDGPAPSEEAFDKAVQDTGLV